jgi:hypothetical protein
MLSKSRQVALEEIAKSVMAILFFVAYAAAFIIMLAIGACGLSEIARSLLGYAGILGASIEHEERVRNTITGTLVGFELLLLAPLVYVIVISVGRFLFDIVQHGAAGASEHQMHRVKALMVNLMVSMVATDMLKRFIGHPEVNITAAIYGGSMILLLTVYLTAMLWGPSWFGADAPSDPPGKADAAGSIDAPRT